MFRRLLAALLSATLIAALAACGSNEGSAQKAGVAMPTTTSDRWVKDGEAVQAQLEALGYDVTMLYAEDDVPTQVEQVGQLIDEGVELLIIGSVDGTALKAELDRAEAAGIPIIAYDRLIRDSGAVDYYATFDNFQVGVQQGTALLQGLGVLDAAGLPTKTTETFNVEVFAGSPDDNNATVFYNGAMSVLQPYFDNKTLNIPSGEVAFDTVAIQAWSAETGGERMASLLSGNSDTLDGVLSPYDGISRAIIDELKNAGYGTAAKPLPTVTGQDAELDSVKSIAAGEQSSTIYKDTRQLAEVAVLMGHQILQGQTPEVNDTASYDNGVKVIPSYLLSPLLVTADNYRAAVVETGYYTEDQLS